MDQQTAQIVILETSDVHGNIFPINYGNNTYANVGLGKIATLIYQEKQKHENLLLVDNGDLIQGTPLTYHYVHNLPNKENPMIKVLNELKYDAAVIGNHEFNYGIDILNHAVQQSDFPWLSANIKSKLSGHPYFGKPYIVKELAGIKIAILGVTTHYIPNWENPSYIEELSFDDAYTATKDWVEKIKKDVMPDLLIVSYHGGFERNLETGEETENQTGENQAYRICKEIEGIDVLLTGHQHRMLQGNLNGVAIVQPSFNGQALGKISITFVKNHEKWIIQEKSSELLSVNSIDAEKSILTLVTGYENETQKWLDQPIGIINGDMLVHGAMEIRLKDNPLIEFINKVQIDIANVEISSTALFYNQSPGFKKDVTMRDIVSNYIYPNTLKVLRVKGQDIKDALERSAAYFEINEQGQIDVNPAFSDPKPQHYNYDMWEGIEYLINVSKPIGKRIVKLTVKGVPIDLEAEYDVVMNNYRAGGGGEYHMYKGKPVVKDINIDMAEIIANYILKRKVIEATVNHNWEVVKD